MPEPRVEASAGLKDDLSPKIREAANNVSGAVGKMKGDFADLSSSSSSSFGKIGGSLLEMAGSFATGQIAADLFRSAIRQVGQFVSDTSNAYLEHNRALKEAGGSYDFVIDKLDEAEQHMRENDVKIGEHTSKWKEFWAAVRGGGSDVAVAFTEGMPDDPDHARSVAKNRGITSVGPTIVNPGNYRPGSPFSLLGSGFQAEGQARNQERIWKQMADENERAAKAAEREAAAKERAAEAQIRASNRGFVRALNGRMRGYGKSDFAEDPIDPTDPYGTNKSAFQAPSDGSRDSEFGAYSPLPGGYMKALQDGQDKALAKARQWGSLFNNVIGGTLDAALNDTRNFGKNFVAILKNAFAQALTKKLVGIALSFIPGGEVVRTVSGGLGETSLTIPRLQREIARGRF